MSKKKIYTEQIKTLSASARIDKAKEVTKKLTNLVLDTIQLHETNKIVVYTPTLTRQIPHSLAAWAYNNFQNSLHHYEIIRICAFWDKAASNAETIPTVIELIDDNSVIAALADDLRSHFSNIEHRNLNADHEHDPDIRIEIDRTLKLSNLQFGNEQAQELESGLRKTIHKARDVAQSQLYITVKTLRDRNLAHSLTETWNETKATVRPMKYGDETKLLTDTIEIIQNLNLWVNGSGYDISGDCTNHAKEKAEELWNNCMFDIE